MFRAQFAHHKEFSDANCTYAASGIVTLCKWPSCATAKEGYNKSMEHKMPTLLAEKMFTNHNWSHLRQHTEKPIFLSVLSS